MIDDALNMSKTEPITNEYTAAIISFPFNLISSLSE